MFYFSCILGRDWFLRFFYLLWYTPSHRKFLSVTELATILGRFLVVSLWGFLVFNVLKLLLISLFLCWVWGHVFLVGSWRSKFCLSMPVFSLFLSFSSYTRVLLSDSCVHAGFLGIVMYEHTNKCNTKTRRNREQVNKIKHIVPPTPNKNKELPQWSHQFCYGEKLPMAWGVPQQTTRHQKSIFLDM